MICQMIEYQLFSCQDEFRFGTILISTKDFKKTLENEISQWINMLTKVKLKKTDFKMYI